MARRDLRRRDWPTGLYESRPGYYVFKWSDPVTHARRQAVIGRVLLPFAKSEALAALQKLSGLRPRLVELVSSDGYRLADLLARLPKAANRNTSKANRYKDDRILEHFGPTARVASITTAQCAECVEYFIAQDQLRSAVALRARLVYIFRRAIGYGMRETNPAEAVIVPAPEIKRERLTLEQFHTVRNAANPMLRLGMDALLLTGQDRKTVLEARRSHVTMINGEPHILMHRSKTAGKRVSPRAIPLALRLDVVNMSVGDVVERGGSDYIIANPDGTPIAHERLSKYFLDTRRKVGIPDVMPSGLAAPTYYEIKSLSKRLYKAQGNVDTQILFGHTKDTDALYADPRGSEPVIVRIK